MPPESPAFQPFHEPLRSTLLRTVAIALLVGALLAVRMGGLNHWPSATLVAFWPSFGGHWVELLFLNVLRSRLPVARSVQVASRLTVWFIGGTALAFCMRLTATALFGFHPAEPAWWLGGLAFIGIELIVHLVLQLRGCSSFYNGRG